MNKILNSIRKKIQKINKSYLLSLLLLIVIAVIIFIPTMQIRFNWVDDGWDIIVAKKLIEYFSTLNFGEIFNLIVEKSIGRFRPVYWIWQTAVYLLSGNSSESHYLLHAILIFGTCILIFKTVYFFTKSKIGSFFAGSLFLLIPLNTANWVRLGPAEPLLGFFVISSIYIFFRYNNIIISSLVLLFAFLCKEPAIALVPSIAVYYLAKRITGEKDKKLLKYLIYSFFLLTFTLLVTFSIRSGYSTFYEFNVLAGSNRFSKYLTFSYLAFPIGLLLVATYLFRIIQISIKKNFKKISNVDLAELFFLVLYISFLVVQSPWKWVMGRYMLPAIVGGVVFLGIELTRVLDAIRKYSIVLFVTSLAFFVILYSSYIYNNLIKINDIVLRTKHSTQSLQDMFKYLSLNTPEGGKVFLNFKKDDSTEELLVETAQNLDLFYHRPDIEIKYLEDRSISESHYLTVSGSAMEKRSYIDEDNLINDKNLNRSDRIIETSNITIISTPINVVKQFIKKTASLLIKGTKITPDGIYTNYQLKDHWNFYYMK